MKAAPKAGLGLSAILLGASLLGFAALYVKWALAGGVGVLLIGFYRMGVDAGETTPVLIDGAPQGDMASSQSVTRSHPSVPLRGTRRSWTASTAPPATQ